MTSSAPAAPASSDATLPERAAALFGAGLARTRDLPPLTRVHAALGAALERIRQPMRVAVVGRIKAGKSTLLNALLGEELLASGTEELTFNVNRLRHAESPSLVVHFKDGRSSELRALDELEALTRRRDENRAFLSSIRYVEVFHPNAFLRSFDLIDTPGLRSFFEQDSLNTLEFLRRTQADLETATQEEAANADALLFLFQGGVSYADRTLLADFLGPLLGRITPVTAIGVMTMVDTFWAQGADPAADGDRLARAQAEDPHLRDVFYDVYPAAGLLGLGAQLLTPREFDRLKELSRLPEERLARLLRSAVAFCEREHGDISVPAMERAALWRRIGQYGCWRACALLRADLTLGHATLSARLLEESGIPAVRAVLLSHFGGRAAAIKVGAAVESLTALCHLEKQRVEGECRRTVEELSGELERFTVAEHALAEQALLRSHYQRQLDFTPEEAGHLLQVTGEKGMSLHARLGLNGDPPAGVPVLMERARERLRYWQVRANDVLVSRESALAADAMTRAYERLFHRVRRIQELL
jgi:hypothetical protein